jgi:hypothetical protein
MTLSKQEKTMAMAMKDPRFPMSCVEGTFKGERAVFMCLMDQNESGEGYDMTPVAMLLAEDDLKHVKGNDDQELGDNPDAPPPKDEKKLVTLT